MLRSPARTTDVLPDALSLERFPRAFAAAMVANLAVLALLRLYGNPPWAGDVGGGVAVAVFWSYRPRWWERPHRAAVLREAVLVLVLHAVVRALWSRWS